MLSPHGEWHCRYGTTADGFDTFVSESIAGFEACEATHGTRRCAFLFEMLEKRFADVCTHGSHSAHSPTATVTLRSDPDGATAHTPPRSQRPRLTSRPNPAWRPGPTAHRPRGHCVACCLLWQVFFHCDQLIRSVYHPFVAEWTAAFPHSTRVQ
jgi:hypothetical protein